MILYVRFVYAFVILVLFFFFFSSRRRHTRWPRDWSSDVCSSDLASELRVFLQMVLPLSKAVIAVIALFYAVGYWNVFFNAMIYIHDTEKWPIQVVLNQYVVQNSDLAQVTNPDKPPPPRRRCRTL